MANEDLEVAICHLKEAMTSIHLAEKAHPHNLSISSLDLAQNELADQIKNINTYLRQEQY